MKIGYISDLHMEFSNSKKVDIPDCDVLILAGDIYSSYYIKEYYDYLNSINNVKHIVAVLGNHEFYGGEYNQLKEDYKKMFEEIPNATLLDIDKRFYYNDIEFIGCTMWTDFFNGDPLEMLSFNQYMNDPRQIRFKDLHLSAHIVSSINQKEVDYLTNNISEDSVVVTHHGASLNSISEIYKSSNFNGSFTSDMEDLIIKTKPKYWIQGHTHKTLKYKVRNTTVLCNPRGYPGEKGYDVKVEVFDF